jgi:hypothetical protein
MEFVIVRQQEREGGLRPCPRAGTVRVFCFRGVR